MANKPYKPCRHPGCSAVTQETYCIKHRPSDKDKRSAEANEYRKWYNRDSWKKIRKEQLIKEPFCRVCASRKKRMRATEVDHIIPHRGNPELFYSKDNLQSLCHVCHSKKTKAEGGA